MCSDGSVHVKENPLLEERKQQQRAFRLLDPLESMQNPSRTVPAGPSLLDRPCWNRPCRTEPSLLDRPRFWDSSGSDRVSEEFPNYRGGGATLVSGSGWGVTPE